MTDYILTLNIGSSSVKAALYGAAGEAVELVWSARVEGIGANPRAIIDGAEASTSAQDHPGAAVWIIDAAKKRAGAGRIAAAGHRIVHGGAKHSRASIIDDVMLEELRVLTPLAPGHQPFNLMGVERARAALGGALQVACFDTAFHATMPDVEKAFAIPRRYAERGVKRYGFHGLSYAYVASQLPRLLGDSGAGRVIVAHLGAGASLCAMRDGRSLATTMGFTALDGLPMATRCGSIDPGVLLYLLQEEGLTAEALGRLLHAESGLLGVSGISGDMRTLLASDDPRAAEAIDLFAYRVARELGALAAIIGGVDALIFTGGVGENAPTIRERVCSRAEWLGVALDAAANAAGEERISSPESRVSVFVTPTDEEREIARETRRLLNAQRESA